jgi:hypothetical protein
MWQDIVGWISDPVGEDDAPDAGSV